MSGFEKGLNLPFILQLYLDIICLGVKYVINPAPTQGPQFFFFLTFDIYVFLLNKLYHYFSGYIPSWLRSPVPHDEPPPYYEEPAPHYEEPAPHYEEPTPHYEEPTPHYEKPSPHYEDPAPHYDEPEPYPEDPHNEHATKETGLYIFCQFYLSMNRS